MIQVITWTVKAFHTDVRGVSRMNLSLVTNLRIIVSTRRITDDLGIFISHGNETSVTIRDYPCEEKSP